MERKTHTGRRLLGALAAVSLALGAAAASPAAAGEWGRGKYDTKRGHVAKHWNAPKWKAPKYGSHHYRHVPKHYGKKRYQPHRHRHHHFVYRDRHGHEAFAAIIGFGLGFATHAILDRDDRYVRERVTYVPYPETPPPVALSPDGRASCVMTREYQTTITVGGRERAAYGTACMQPDGSWLLGEPEAEPL
jgi:hypothetical protein